MPWSRYLNYLLATLGLDEDQVRRIMELDQMVLPTDAEIAEARFGLNLPKDFNPFDEKHSKSFMWLGNHGLLHLSKGRIFTQGAFLLLRGPAREIVETLILGGWTSGSIANFVQDEKLGPCGADWVDSYEKLFWDVREMPFPRLVAFLARHPAGDVFTDVLERGPGRAREVAEVLVHRNARHLELRPQVRIEIPPDMG